MFRQLTRRLLFKAFAVLAALFHLRRPEDADAQDATDESDFALTPVGHWSKSHDRVWLGEEFWANPMEDWSLVDGGAECQTSGGNRNVQLLTHSLRNASSFKMSVQIRQIRKGQNDGGCGFRVGVCSEIDEHRSNCFARGGIDAGLVDGQLVLGKNQVAIRVDLSKSEVILTLSGEVDGERHVLTLSARNAVNEKPLGSIRGTFSTKSLIGNVAIVNNYDASIPKGRGGRYRFSNWAVGGNGFTATPENKFGPLLWTMYSLSDSRGDDGFVLKLSALTGPLGKDDNHFVVLQTKQDGDWVSIDEFELDSDAWTASIRVPNWNEKKETAYRVLYEELHKNGEKTQHEWAGTIKANPTGRPLRLGALTCQNDYGFPYEPVADNVVKLDPDMLYFSGDQIYEGHGGFGIIREPAAPAILNYLRKFYQFGWAFREAMRDRPTICIADDHDVFQGNIWGEGGAKMKDLARGASSKGGYREPARMVNAVHRTCTAHHPDFFDPTPSKQDISVYYGDMVYGNVSFAILGDRQWKSGPERVETGSGRADHVSDRDFDTSVLDVEGLVLLGERQEEFLRKWGEDWRGHSMKVLLSQTVFAAVATHHGRKDGYLKADLDSGGWPQTARNNAIEIIRKSKALHINGDQHLATLSQYGVDKQRDSNWSFCTPAISAGYPRWWRPDDLMMPHENRPEHGLADTGEFIDGFGNKVYVYAVGNPVVGRDKNRYRKAHEKGSGFGLVTIDTEAKTYLIESFRFLIDATDGKPANQFPGWPVTIHQDENAGENKVQ
jgi:hypothetical protein